MTEPMNSYITIENSGNYLSQNFLLEIINSACNPIFVKNRQHQWIFFNNAFCELAGCEAEELTGKSGCDFFSTEQADILREKDELIFNSGINSDSEGYFNNAQGKTYIVSIKNILFNDESGHQFIIGSIKEIRVWENKHLQEEQLDTNKIPLQDEENNVVGLLATIEDITAQKQAEETLRESEEKFHQLSTNVPGMLYKFKMHPDGSMSFTYVSPGSYDLLGIEADKIQAESSLLISMIHLEDYKTFEKSLTNSAETLEPLYWEGRLIKSEEKIQ